MTVVDDPEKLAANMTLVQIALMKSLALCSVAIFGLTGCGAEPLCSSEVLQVARDLGSDRYAVASVRDCGATTDYATVVRVGRASKPQSAAKEVFVADSDHGAATSDSRGAVWLSVVWTASGKLSIVHSSKARIFKHLPDAEGASVTYRASDPLSSPPVNGISAFADFRPIADCRQSTRSGHSQNSIPNGTWDRVKRPLRPSREV